MSMPGQIVVRMGKTVVNFHRHFGSMETSGITLLQVCMQAHECKERSQFHEGGYAIRMLADLPSTLSQLGLSKLQNPVSTEFIITDGGEDEGVFYGIEARAIPVVQKSDAAVVHSDVVWEFRYAELEGDVAEDWAARATVFTAAEWKAFLAERILSSSEVNSDPDRMKLLLDAREGMAVP